MIELLKYVRAWFISRNYPDVEIYYNEILCDYMFKQKCIYCNEVITLSHPDEMNMYHSRFCLDRMKIYVYDYF